MEKSGHIGEMSGSLIGKDNIFSLCHWDNVKWDNKQLIEATEASKSNSINKLSTKEFKRLEQQGSKYWDAYYKMRSCCIIKHRDWIFTEFPELALTIDPVEGRRILDVGCGEGKSIIPLLLDTNERNLKVYGCDYSGKALEMLTLNPFFDKERCEVFNMNITDTEWPASFSPNSFHFVILTFVLSTIPPSKMQAVVENSFQYLKPGGMLMFRDYGRYDLAQLRLPDGKCVENNFYVRRDGTFVYFFTKEDVRKLFCEAGFNELQNYEDKRLQVNRKRGLAMYRVWVHAKFQKPL